MVDTPCLPGDHVIEHGGRAGSPGICKGGNQNAPKGIRIPMTGHFCQDDAFTGKHIIGESGSCCSGDFGSFLTGGDTRAECSGPGRLLGNEKY